MLRVLNTESSWKAMILVSNFKKKSMDDEYRKMLLAADDLFTHTWSLSVEMQWYLLVPLIFILQRFVTSWQKTFFSAMLTAQLHFIAFSQEYGSLLAV
ncbi:unnamed protein product [Strongylus vulgaris]|uniref:Uncharacterized protein n=1 Tax=Strongylus vulgaris TaxID=40348 RepID=A0A3P7IPR1_STRVU|nr:unnamed protein product [Strongylus vulgaris]